VDGEASICRRDLALGNSRSCDYDLFYGCRVFKVTMSSALAWLPEHVIKRCLIGLKWPHKNS
jgi:hypothetical protein